MIFVVHACVEGNTLMLSHMLLVVFLDEIQALLYYLTFSRPINLSLNAIKSVMQQLHTIPRCHNTIGL